VRVRGRLDWKVGVSVSRGKAAESLGDWVWRLGLAGLAGEPMWPRGPSVGRGGQGMEESAGLLEREERCEEYDKVLEHVL